MEKHYSGNKVKLLLSMITKGLLGFLLLGALLFGTAGSFDYPYAWALIITLFTLMMLTGILLFAKYPETLERRLKAKEKETAQKWYVSVIGILYLLSFIVAGLDYRFKWLTIPGWCAVTALALMAAGYVMFVMVILQNAYASRVVEVQEGQSVISTGLYSLVRHPMYLACLLVFLPMPVALGSALAFIPMAAFPVSLVLRIRDEERILIACLPGYLEYTQKTKCRLIPFVW